MCWVPSVLCGFLDYIHLLQKSNVEVLTIRTSECGCIGDEPNKEVIQVKRSYGGGGPDLICLVSFYEENGTWTH